MKSPVAEPAPLDLVIDPVNHVLKRFCHIPACPEGFVIGSRDGFTREQPVHRMVIPESFWMGETLVTQAQFAVWTGSDDYQTWLAQNRDKLQSYDSDAHKNDFDHVSPSALPAENLSWHEARGFCAWLNHTGRCGGGKFVALPTEARWEYACRGGTDTDYWNGDGEATLAEVGWYDANSNSQSQPVKSKGKANPYGLFDMHGNLLEWCFDRFDEQEYSAREEGCLANLPDTSEVVDKDSSRVLRGGSWIVAASFCRSAYRGRSGAGDRVWNYGFRVCLFPGPD